MVIINVSFFLLFIILYVYIIYCVYIYYIYIEMERAGSTLAEARAIVSRINDLILL